MLCQIMDVSTLLSTCNGKPYKLRRSYHKIMGLVMGLPFDPDQSDDEDEERPTKRRKKITFAPKAYERQFSGGGTITKESIVPTKRPSISKTKAQMEQSKRDRDIKYVLCTYLLFGPKIRIRCGLINGSIQRMKKEYRKR